MKNSPTAKFCATTMRIGTERMTVTNPVATDAYRSRHTAVSDRERVGAATGIRPMATAPSASTVACTAITLTAPTLSVSPTMRNAINCAPN